MIQASGPTISLRSSKLDPFSDLIGLLRPQAVVSKPISGRGVWGAAYEAYPHPSFCLMLAGVCWFEVTGQPAVRLKAGDFLLLRETPAFTLVSEPGAPCGQGVPSTQAVRHGELDGPAEIEMLGGSFEIRRDNADVLREILPPSIHINADEADTERLAEIVRLIASEASGARPGRETMLRRLLEVMLIEAVRRPGLTAGSGLLAGLEAPGLAVALRALHADVAHPWTVAELARLAGMSRSGFAARFATVVGCPPMEYLARWRMSLARDALSRNAPPLKTLALEIGYESANAFSMAFHRRFGLPPGAFARAVRQI